MSEYKSFTSFQKAFKKAIPHFDETKIHFEAKGKMYHGQYVCFVTEGKLFRIHMYCSTYEITNWSKHFEDFCVTGSFDFNAYWKLYTSSVEDLTPIMIDDVIYSFPMKIEAKNEVNEHSEEMTTFLRNYRSIHGMNVGIQFQPKP